MSHQVYSRDARMYLNTHIHAENRMQQRARRRRRSFICASNTERPPCLEQLEEREVRSGIQDYFATQDL